MSWFDEVTQLYYIHLVSVDRQTKILIPCGPSAAISVIMTLVCRCGMKGRMLLLDTDGSFIANENELAYYARTGHSFMVANFHTDWKPKCVEMTLLHQMKKLEKDVCEMQAEHSANLAVVAKNIQDLKTRFAGVNFAPYDFLRDMQNLLELKFNEFTYKIKTDAEIEQIARDQQTLDDRIEEENFKEMVVTQMEQMNANIVEFTLNPKSLTKDIKDLLKRHIEVMNQRMEETLDKAKRNNGLASLSAEIDGLKKEIFSSKSEVTLLNKTICEFMTHFGKFVDVLIAKELKI